MEYELQLKPFERKEGMKYIVLQLTDIQLHTQKMTQSSIGKKVVKSLETMESGRIYSYLQPKEITDDQFNFTILDFAKKDKVLLKTIQDYESKGYKVLIQIPKNGLPVFPGKDTIEFMNSTNGRRIIRGFEKHKQIN